MAIAAVKDRGFKFGRNADGQPVIRGDAKKLDPELRELLRVFRQEIIEAAHLTPPAVPADQRHKVYMFRGGQTVRLFGDENLSMADNASWWRWSDTETWTAIPGSPGEMESIPAEKP